MSVLRCYMNTIHNLINMSIHITSQTKSLVVRPATKDELRSLIERELYYQGIDADLNHIDTSLITDMSLLFDSLDIRNIKIDEWDVSNVEDMECMFMNQNKFSSDLSGWNTSNVTNMDYMFYDCEKFSSDLYRWNVQKVVNHFMIFIGCDNLLPEYYPQFEIRTRY